MLVLECMENYYDFYGEKALDPNLTACSPANFIDIYRILSVIRSTLVSYRLWYFLRVFNHEIGHVTPSHKRASLIHIGRKELAMAFGRFLRTVDQVFLM